MDAPQEGSRPDRPAQRLPGGGGARTGWQLHGLRAYADSIRLTPVRGRALTLTALASLVLAAPASAAPGSFTTTEVFGGFGATAVAIGDFDGENGPDLAIADKNTGGVSILLNKGDASFDPAPINPPYTTGASPSAILTARLNSDTALDLAVANAGSDDVSILFGDGEGRFSAAGPPLPVGAGPDGITAGTFDQLPGIDLATSNYGSGSASLLMNDGSGGGTFFPSFQAATGLFPSSLVAGQFDASTALDELAVANGGAGTNFPVLAHRRDDVAGRWLPSRNRSCVLRRRRRARPGRRQPGGQPRPREPGLGAAECGQRDLLAHALEPYRGRHGADRHRGRVTRQHR